MNKKTCGMGVRAERACHQTYAFVTCVHARLPRSLCSSLALNVPLAEGCAMASLPHLTVRSAFLELLAQRGGDASERKSRSEGPQARMADFPNEAPSCRPCSAELRAGVVSLDADAGARTHRLIFASGFSESLEACGTEPSACPTPWSSLCGDWGYQGEVLLELAFDLQLEAAPVGTPWADCSQAVVEELAGAAISWSSVRSDWGYQNVCLPELAAAPQPGADWDTQANFNEEPEATAEWDGFPPWTTGESTEATAPNGNAAEDGGDLLASAGPPKAGSYLAALIDGVAATCQPCGKAATLQPASRSPVDRSAGLRAAMGSKAKKAAAAVNAGKGPAESIRDSKGAARGRRRSGKLGGRRRRVPAEVLPA